LGFVAHLQGSVIAPMHSDANLGIVRLTVSQNDY